MPWIPAYAGMDRVGTHEPGQLPSTAAQRALQLALAHLRAAFDIPLLGAPIEFGLRRPADAPRAARSPPPAGPARALRQRTALRRTAILLRLRSPAAPLHGFGPG